MPTPRNYKQYPNPKLWTAEILLQLKEMRMHEFTSSEISDLFQIPIAEACTRINVLKKWKCVKETRLGLYPHVYEITKWGHRYIEKNKDKILEKIKKGADYGEERKEGSKKDYVNDI